MSETGTLSRRDLFKRGGVISTAVIVGPLLTASKAVAANKGLPRWAFVIDLRRCVGCRGCTVACKAEHDVPLGRWNAVVKQIEIGKYPNTKKIFLPRLCNNCGGGKEDAPPCVRICPEFPKNRKKLITADGKKFRYRDGATYKRPDGFIVVDNFHCIGCGKCIKECPYGVRSFNPRLKAGKDPEKNAINKCQFCHHRVDKGLVPSCVNTCQGGARMFGDLNDPASEVSTLAKEFNLLKNREKTTLLNEKGTEPFVFYIDPDNVLKNYKIDPDKKEAEFSDQIV